VLAEFGFELDQRFVDERGMQSAAFTDVFEEGGRLYRGMVMAMYSLHSLTKGLRRSAISRATFRRVLQRLFCEKFTAQQGSTISAC
jgi:hypothetical protein